MCGGVWVCGGVCMSERDRQSCVFFFKDLIHIIAETGQFEIYAAGQHPEDPGELMSQIRSEGILEAKSLPWVALFLSLKAFI